MKTQLLSSRLHGCTTLCHDQSIWRCSFVKVSHRIGGVCGDQSHKHISKVENNMYNADPWWHLAGLWQVDLGHLSNGLIFVNPFKRTCRQILQMSDVLMIMIYYMESRGERRDIKSCSLFIRADNVRLWSRQNLQSHHQTSKVCLKQWVPSSI